MKHIRKKYLFEKEIESIRLNDDDRIIIDVDKLEKDTLKKANKSHNLILQTTDDKSLLAFIYNNNGNYIHVPLPDFTLVYFDFAYKLNSARKDQKKKLLIELSDITVFNEINSNSIYTFYGYSSSCIINLFTSIECFINSMLPEDKKYIEEKNNRTEIYNKVQIQENIPFWDKIKKVLPQYYEKNFFTKTTTNSQHIVNLKELRDNLIHTKSDMTGNIQIDLFKKLLNFKYDETFVAVANFINFYKKDFIEECPCDSDSKKS